ncbi:MAG: hypothetical protein H0V47_02195 [Chloroflexia bacterium]|nr:hypothetical protein [Chloroflexia bacterium]
MADWIRLSDENIVNLECIAHVRMKPGNTCRIYYPASSGQDVDAGVELNEAETEILMQAIEPLLRTTDPRSKVGFS